MVKIVEILTFYPEYLEFFYDKYDFAYQLPYNNQIDLLINDGFGAGIIFTPYLKDFGFESYTIIANNFFSQKAWAKENNHSTPSFCDRPFDFENIDYTLLKRQIEKLQPEVIFFADTIHFHQPFIESLTHKAKLIVGWGTDKIPRGLNWSCYDVIISMIDQCLEKAKSLGAKNTYYFEPGAPDFVYEILKHESKIYDVTFVGQVTEVHSKTARILNHLSQKIHFFQSEFPNINIAYYILSYPNHHLPPGIANLNKGKVFGLDMLKVHRQSKICLNTINFEEGANFRLLEVTCVGSFLLTNHNQNVNRYFTPGVEIGVFENEDELIEKVIFYLKNEEIRENIAKNGFEKLKKKFSLQKRAEEFSYLVKKYIDDKKENKRPISKQAIEKNHTFVGSPIDESFSPLTGEPSKLITTFSSESIIEGYEKAYSMDVGYLFKNHSEVRLYQCPITKLQFFRPKEICGDGYFYSKLSRFPWYYKPDKWEHRIAYDFIKPNSSVLEIGCGQGSFLKKLTQKNCFAVGLELDKGISEDLIYDKIYFESIQDHSRNNLKVYDYVCMFQVLEHIPDLKNFLLSAISVTKDNGYLIVSVPNQDSFIALDKFNLLDLPPHHMTRWKPETFLALEKIFPLKLMEVKVEPLQNIHFEWFKNIMALYVMDSKILDQIVKISQEKPYLIKGHTFIGFFKKLSYEP